jgi:hypothetical protein
MTDFEGLKNNVGRSLPFSSREHFGENAVLLNFDRFFIDTCVTHQEGKQRLTNKKRK